MSFSTNLNESACAAGELIRYNLTASLPCFGKSISGGTKLPRFLLNFFPSSARIRPEQIAFLNAGLLKSAVEITLSV